MNEDVGIRCRCGITTPLDEIQVADNEYRCPACGWHWRMVVAEPARTLTSGFQMPAKWKAETIGPAAAAEHRQGHPAGTECIGHGRGGTGRCCDRAGEYDGFHSDGGPWFTCQKRCSCHD